MENSEDKFESQINDAHSDMSMKHSARKDGYVEAEMSHLSHRKIEEDKHGKISSLSNLFQILTWIRFYFEFHQNF